MQAGKQPKVELFPESNTRFFLKGANVKVSFDVDENGNGHGAHAESGGEQHGRKAGRSDATLSLERLNEFAGKYFNDELQVTYTVVLNKDRLTVTAPRDFEFSMRHVQNDEFTMSRGDMIFHRSEEGGIASFLLDVKPERLSFRFEKVAAK